MMMMAAQTAFWSLLSSVIVTTLLAASQGFGFTRMNIPYLLGTIVTPDRDRAKLYGFLMHLVIGLTISYAYLFAFHAWSPATWWKGTILGLVQGSFLLTFGLTLLPAVHPRMASEQQGPTEVRQLEPPGFLGLNYGVRTPVSVLLAHLVWGLLLGVALP